LKQEDPERVNINYIQWMEDVKKSKEVITNCHSINMGILVIPNSRGFSRSTTIEEPSHHRKMII